MENESLEYMSELARQAIAAQTMAVPRAMIRSIDIVRLILPSAERRWLYRIEQWAARVQFAHMIRNWPVTPGDAQL
jgi:hypothetical protein